MPDPRSDDHDSEQEHEERTSRETGGDAEAAGSIEEREDVAEELIDETGDDG